MRLVIAHNLAKEPTYTLIYHDGRLNEYQRGTLIADMKVPETMGEKCTLTQVLAVMKNDIDKAVAKWRERRA